MPSPEFNTHSGDLTIDGQSTTGVNHTSLQSQQQISPNSLRRSSRVSALREQKKQQESDRHSELNHSSEHPSMVDSHGGDSLAEPPLAKKAAMQQFAYRDGRQSESRSEEDGDEDMDMDGHAVDGQASPPGVCEIVAKKKKNLKRKLADAEKLDQYDAKFGIRLDDHGDVIMMSDGSEVSSLDAGDVNHLREEYDTAKKNEVSAEVKAHRATQIHELAAALRMEEAKLAMLKKIRTNQQQGKAARENQASSNKQMTISNIAQNTSGNAYRPVVANSASTPNANACFQPHGGNHKLNGVANVGGKASKGQAKIGASTPLSTNAGGGTSSSAAASVAAALAGCSGGMLNPQQQQLLQSLLARANNNPQQFAQLLRQLTPANIAALMSQQQQNAQQQQQAAAAALQQQQAAAAAAAKTAAAQAAAKAKEIAQNNVQKIATARQQLRNHLEQQMLQLPTPKAPLSELPFLPNANQADFCALLGLDLTVQRVLKDKAVFRRVDFPPYICEECGTDFTPAWKAIAGEKENFHLYCEECVKEAQKRKVRIDYMSLLGRAFQKVGEQEKEFERRAAAGEFSDPIPPIPSSAASSNSYTPSPGQQAAQTSNLRSTGSPMTTATPPSKSAATTGQLGTNYALQRQQQQHSGPNMNGQQESSTMASSRQSGGSGGQRGTKKRASGPNNTPTSAAASAAGAASSLLNAASGMSNSPQLQQQRLMLQWMMSQMGNPLLAAMFQNPALAHQFGQLMNAQRLPQQQGTGNTNSNVPIAAAALLAAAHQSAQQHNQQQQNNASSHASGGSKSSGSANSSDGGINPLVAAQLRQLGSSGLMNNPQLLQMLQQVQLSQMRDYAVKGSGGKK